MEVRIAKIEEFKKLWNYSNSPTYLYFLEQLINENIEFWTVVLSNKLIGELYIFWDSEDKDEANGTSRAYLCAYRIESEHQGKGYGKQLMNTVLKRIKNKGFNEVTIGVDNNEFIKLEVMYKKIGFTTHVKSTNVDLHNISDSLVPIRYEEPYVLMLKKL
ncbi:MAG: GNAT family N-acetyltransferase [Candidatus Izemoplasma sp.]